MGASKGMAAASQDAKEMATDDGNVSDDGFAVVDKPDDETPMGTTVVATTTVDVTDPSVTTSDNKTKKTVTIDEKPPPTDPTRLALYQMALRSIPSWRRSSASTARTLRRARV